MTHRAEFERLLDVYGFRCERFGQDLSTHARAQVVSAFAVLASAPVAGEAVGKVVLFGGDLKEVSWTAGKMPPPGTTLYGAPQASEAVRDAAAERLHALVHEAISWIETGGGPAVSLCADLRAALSAQPGAQKNGGSDAE
ncbi:hypothetical protein D9M68_582350 [compost metagenome]